MYQTEAPKLRDRTDEQPPRRAARPNDTRLAEARGQIAGSLALLVRLASAASAHDIPSARRILVWASTVGQQELANASDGGARLLELADEIDALTSRLLRRLGTLLARDT